MVSSHTHAAKRPYAGTHSQSSQSQITSYFTTSSLSIRSNISTKDFAVKDIAPTLAPAVPSHIQSSLLNVGMRVRKSVPEGYKTGTYSSFKLFSESTAGTASYLPQKPLAETKKQTPKARYGGAVKELAPFCGIMKVGGLAQQVTATVTEVDENDDCPPLSQGSDFTPPCSQEQEYELPANTHKRRHEDDETIEGEKWVFGWGRSDEVERSDRPMAAMKTRRGKAGKGGVMMVSNGAKSGVDDFEDAEFLDYSALAEGDAEMGGI